MIPLRTPDEIAASLLDPRLTKKSKGPSQARVRSALAEGVDEVGLIDFYVEIENNLERDEGTSSRATSIPTPRLGKRLGALPFVADVSTSGPSYGGILVHASTSGHGLSLRGAIVSGYTRKSEDEVLRRQVDPLDSLAHTALARDVECLICMKVLPPLHILEKSGMAVMHRSTLLVSHGAQLNSHYTGLVLARNRLQEKFDRKAGYVKVLYSEVTNLDGKLKRMQKNCDALVQENGMLRSQKDDASVKLKELQTKLTDARNQLALEKGKSQIYKDAMDGLRDEVTQFIGSGVRSLVRKGLCMGRTDVEFEAVVQKVSNFHVGAKADFDKALVDFPTTPFPYLNKIDAASGGTLFEVTQVFPDKNIRSVIPYYVVHFIVNEDVDQVLLEHASDA
nr:hypothetical protein [Tanacetum cinerariifolium]